MVNRNYNNGRAFEYRIMTRLESLGWFCIRAAGSHGPVDVLACKGTRHLGIQCKSGRYTHSIDDWDGLWGRCIEHRWTPIFALKGMRFMQLTGAYSKGHTDFIEVNIT